VNELSRCALRLIRAGVRAGERAISGNLYQLSQSCVWLQRSGNASQQVRNPFYLDTMVLLGGVDLRGFFCACLSRKASC